MSTAAVLESLGPAAQSSDALHEVVDGRRVEMPPMSAYATLIAARLAYRMGPLAESRRLGTVVPEMLFILDRARDIRRRPDVAFVSSSRWALDRIIPETGDWDVIPDLAVEVVSPNESFEELLGKVDEYFQSGVQRVWIVVPAQKKSIDI
jgi:Uma2 family endonuclease